MGKCSKKSQNRFLFTKYTSLFTRASPPQPQQKEVSREPETTTTTHTHIMMMRVRYAAEFLFSVHIILYTHTPTNSQYGHKFS